MKKLIAVLFALATIFIFTSCLSGGEDVGPKEGRGLPTLNSGSSEEVHGEADSTGLTDADMKALIKNYGKIMKDLDNFGDDYTEDSYGTYNDDLNAVFEKNGISGPNAYDKFVMVSYCASILDYEAEMKKDFTTQLTLKAAGIDPIAEYRKLVNDDDFAIVKANYKEYKKAVNNY